LGRQRHINALRSALRAFYPGALAALGGQLAQPEALAVLELAPTPEQGRRLTRTAIRAALVGAGRHRNLQARVVAVHAALAAPQLAAPAPVEAAYNEVVGALAAMLGARVLGEFGDDPHRYATAKGRKAFAGTAPVTRSSGLRTVVVARGRAISGWRMPAICGRSRR
jgi:hypothetical protein